MIALDTNVLLRLFVVDSPEQAAAVRSLIDDPRRVDDKVFLSPLVLAELCWAMGKIYRKPKSDMLASLHVLLENDLFAIGDREAVEVALEAWTTGKADFADYLIAAIARAAGARTTYTFDTEAAKMRPAFALLEV